MIRKGARTFSQSGAALIELALVLPLLAFLSFGTIQFTNVLQNHQILSQVSREAANIAHRSCFYSTAPGTCLADPLTFDMSQFEVYKARELPAMEIFVTMYDLDTTVTPWTVTRIASTQSANYNAVNHPSKFTTTLNWATFGVSAFSPTKKRVVIAETFYTHNPLQVVDRFNIMGVSELYEVTIF